MYRKFYLKNGLDETYYLSDANYKHFLGNPAGLGFDKNITDIRVGNKKIISSKTYELPQPSGEVIFYDAENAYQDYYNFVNFLSHEPIRLYYIPSNAIEPYYIECEVVTLEKTEINQEDATLRCPISFYGKSMWLTSKEYELKLTNAPVGLGKSYDLVRPYSYAGNTLSDIDFNNNGQLSCAFKMEINGLVQNPQLSAYDENGVKYGAIKLNGTFDYVRINTNDDSQEIYLENEGSVIANPTSYQDLSIADGFSILTFFKFKVGKSKLVFTSGNIDTFEGQVILSWSNEFISV